MVADLERLVVAESPSNDPAACAACAEEVQRLARGLIGTEGEVVRVDGRIHLRWRFGGTPRVLLLCHYDTVWPLHTLDRWPFEVVDGRATGPGVYDMKAGIVMALHALATLDDLEGVVLLVTGDEEIGSLTSQRLIEDTARGMAAALVLESAGPDGALKTARKGVSMYTLEITGLAAHAGLEPERGVNALLELTEQVRRITALADPARGTTVTPTVASASTTINVVPAAARVEVDVRAADVAEQARVDAHLRALEPVLPGATLTLRGGINRPPLAESSSRMLYARACRVARELGLEPPPFVHVGGASDGNFTAGIGVPTLDGLGSVGGGAHAEGEHVIVAEMPPRAAFLAALVDDLR